MRKKAEEKAKQSYYTEDLLSGDEVDEEVTEEPSFDIVKPFKKRFRFRPYNGFKGGANANLEGPIRKTKKIGRKVRKGLRPKGKFFVQNRYESSSSENSGENSGIVPTFRPGAYRIRRVNNRPVNRLTESTTQTTVKTEDYKKKFRPFFDKLYSKFTQTAEADSSEEPILRRSTTNIPPITLGKSS